MNGNERKTVQKCEPEGFPLWLILGNALSHAFGGYSARRARMPPGEGRLCRHDLGRHFGKEDFCGGDSGCKEKEKTDIQGVAA